MSEEPQPQRMQQTMPENGGGWHQVEAGPHLHVMFHPNRQLLGREQDGIERPSIVVAVAGKREQALRFDPFSVGSHYHIRPGVRGRQIPLWVEEEQKPLCPPLDSGDQTVAVAQGRVQCELPRTNFETKSAQTIPPRDRQST